MVVGRATGMIRLNCIQSDFTNCAMHYKSGVGKQNDGIDDAGSRSIGHYQALVPAFIPPVTCRSIEACLGKAKLTMICLPLLGRGE